MKRWYTHTTPFYPHVLVSMGVLESIPHGSPGMTVSTNYIFCSRAWWAQAREGRESGVCGWWLAVRVESVNLVTESLWSLAENSHTFLIRILKQALILKMKSLRPAKIECSVQLAHGKTRAKEDRAHGPKPVSFLLFDLHFIILWKSDVFQSVEYLISMTLLNIYSVLSPVDHTTE